jgi:SulP family sulfate permease
MLITFVLTVVIDLTIAIEVGVVSPLLFMKRMSEVSQVNAITRDLRKNGRRKRWDQAADPRRRQVFEVYGSLFFGAVDQFTEAIA